MCVNVPGQTPDSPGRYDVPISRDMLYSLVDSEFVIKPLLNENPAVLDNVRLSIRIVASDILIGQTKAIEKELGEARLWRFSDSIDVCVAETCLIMPEAHFLPTAPQVSPSFFLQVFRENGQLAAERMSSISHNVVHICTRLTKETTSGIDHTQSAFH